jgi:hypothetical protein
MRDVPSHLRSRDFGIHSGRLWEPMAKRKGSIPSALRLRALLEVLGFEGRGGQTRFAEEIDVDRRRLNNVLVYRPLSRKLVEKIIGRYPGVSTDFLLLGRPGGSLDRKLEQHLFEYEEKTGISIFNSRAP